MGGQLSFTSAQTTQHPAAGHVTGPCNWLPIPTRQGRDTSGRRRPRGVSRGNTQQQLTSYRWVVGARTAGHRGQRAAGSPAGAPRTRRAKGGEPQTAQPLRNGGASANCATDAVPLSTRRATPSRPRREAERRAYRRPQPRPPGTGHAPSVACRSQTPPLAADRGGARELAGSHAEGGTDVAVRERPVSGPLHILKNDRE